MKKVLCGLVIALMMTNSGYSQENSKSILDMSEEELVEMDKRRDELFIKEAYQKLNKSFYENDKIPDPKICSWLFTRAEIEAELSNDMHEYIFKPNRKKQLTGGNSMRDTNEWKYMNELIEISYKYAVTYMALCN